MSAWTLCIDFGTAFSKAAAAPRNAWTRFDPGAVRPLMVGGVQEAGNAFLLDSAVFVDEKRVLFGRAAIARANAVAQKRRQALRSFKTLLSVNDLDRALNANAPTSYDPHRIFQMRDLVVLYLAYLLGAVDEAAAADQVLRRATSIDWRYAAPSWRGVDVRQMHESITHLFGEAQALRLAAGPALLEPDGLSIDTIGELMPKVANADPIEMDLIFEASAAAAYSSIGLESRSSHFVVVDMGAGTTDIAALARDDNELVELPQARATLKKAGDFIDQIIANVVLDSARNAKTVEQKVELWQILMAQMRDLKESLFADGRASLRYEGKVLTVTQRDIERDSDFKGFAASLGDKYAAAVRAAAEDAAKTGGRSIQAIAVGGGASAPFIQALIRIKPRGKIAVTPRPATPQWAHAPEFEGNLAPIFPQLAIAIGGALAPDSMLAARGPNPPEPA